MLQALFIRGKQLELHRRDYYGRGNSLSMYLVLDIAFFDLGRQVYCPFDALPQGNPLLMNHHRPRSRV